MGSTRSKPDRLAEKLLQIRNALALSQSEMLKRLGFEDAINYTRLSGFESGLREPTLMILLQYARVANVYVEVLIDDELDLPDKLPSPKKSEGVKRPFASRSQSKKR
ncbi:MAG TPA: helix-turn-helix transcriptional regulator [Pyrinomonadaceae bacterium]|jgi:transcriptional regulator with XRE-family HTH domain|nr:helix-turn-helix transcriptional regulator [Pyrinomonadaceae bacterium]